MPLMDNLQERPLLRAYLGAPQTLINNTNAVVLFDEVNFDTVSMLDIAAGSKIRIKQSGYYAMTCQVEFASNASGTRKAIFKLNGTTELVHEIASPSGYVETYADLDTLEYLTEGDYIEVIAFQDSSGNLDLGSGRDETFITIQRVA